MADSDNNSFSVPWAPLLSLIAVIAGLSTLLPSKSARPAAAGMESVAVEPFAFYDGISIWPGDFVRLFIVFLGVHFIWKTLGDLESNSHRLAAEFGRDLGTMEYPPENTTPAPSGTTNGSGIPILSRTRDLLNRLWPHGTVPSGSDSVNSDELFTRYCPWSQRRMRLLRTIVMLAIYLVLIVMILLAFPSSMPSFPVRGDALSVSRMILFAAVIITLTVSFLVLDATLLNCLFIRDLNRGQSIWKLPQPIPDDSKFRFKTHHDLLEAQDLADYLDIHYIARRSNAVNHLIYFPFILLALLVAARWSKTDNYNWPPMLITIMALHLFWSVYCAIRLPLEARAARSECLRQLRAGHFKQQAIEAAHPDKPKPMKSSAATLETVIKEIENLREGAFVGIWDQPLLRAILVPSGGVGLWALLDHLPS
ncbi:MAG: hypothetical protein V4689_18605 [Verrucomicrobiota bacterium]